MTGSTIGHYVISGKLGAGGMGEVWRARDTRLNRDVAIKILPPSVAADPHRLARFEREAQVLASLSHPNIAVLHGIEISGDAPALIMELVEGETLSDRIRRGPIALEEAIPLARQIAEALESAHESGVIHRDLKPANVMITPQGLVKLLDFGLAKALDDAPVNSKSQADSPTLSIAATRAGMLLGTAGYMSPEQVKGKAADKRADIWAFGVVLYEMLTGKQLYRGETIADSLAAVITTTPDTSVLPPQVRRLVDRCLEKDPRRRLRDIGEARIVLENPVAEVGPAEAGPRAKARPPWATFVATVAVIVAATVSWMHFRESSPAPLQRRFEIAADRLNVGFNNAPVVSPDGKRIVYAAAGMLWIRDLDQLEPRLLADASDAMALCWSPESTYVAYVSENKLWKVPASGGQPIVVAPVRALGRGTAGAWLPDGRIVLAIAMPPEGLMEVPSNGGELTSLLAPRKGEQDYHEVSPLPGGKGVLFVIDRGSGASDTISALAGGAVKEILRLKDEIIRWPVYASGHIVFHRERVNPGLWAIPFSLDRLAATGPMIPVAPDGQRHSVSRDGTLVYVRAPADVGKQLVWVDRAGKRLGAAGDPQRGICCPELSPDGRRVAYSVPETSGRRDVWVVDLARNARSRQTFTDDVDESQPAWAPSGDVIAFVRGALPKGTIWAKSVDSSAPASRLADGFFPAFAPDGKTLAFSEVTADAGTDLWSLPLSGGAKPVPFLQQPARQFLPVFSPDGRFLAYISTESGRLEVFVKPFPGGEAKWQVSSAGGMRPRWKRSDRLYYRGVNDEVMEVDVTTRPAVVFGTPRTLFRAEQHDINQDFDVSADGSRFLLVLDAEGSNTKPPSMVVVENALRELGKK